MPENDAIDDQKCICGGVDIVFIVQFLCNDRGIREQYTGYQTEIIKPLRE